jgi:hypothetical protein
MEQICEWCGLKLKTTDKRRKYHVVNENGIKCAKEASKWKKAERQARYDKEGLRYKLGGQHSIRQYPKTDEEGNIDFEEEGKCIDNQLKKLGLR